MRHVLAAVAVSVVIGASASPASAKDLTGRFGIGYSTTLPGSPGGGALSAISSRYWVNEQIGIEANLGVLLISPKGGDSSTNFGLGLGGLYSFIDEPNMHVYGDAGLSFGSVAVTTTTPTATATDSKTAIGVTAGLGMEFFLVGLPNLGFATQVGLSYTSVEDSGSIISVGGADYAQFGIRYYFGGPKGPPK